MNQPAPPPQLLNEIVEVLSRIAPEVIDSPVDPHRPLRDQIEMDSMDHLHFAIGLHERFGVDIPESDYRAMRCLRDLAFYIQAHIKR